MLVCQQFEDQTLPSSQVQFSLAELIDLETIAAKDRELTPEELRARDAEVARKLQSNDALPLDQWSPERLIKGWVGILAPDPSPGRKLVSLMKAIDLLLVLFALTIGAGAALTVLQYDGTTPINVVEYLALFVGLQILLLVVLIGSVVLGPRLGLVQQMIRSFVYFQIRLPDALADAATTFKRFRKSYSKTEYWTFMAMTQKFAVAFNFGALVVSMYLVATSDLAFRWSTTLSITPEGFHKALQVLGAPWQFLGDEWNLTINQVNETRYIRLEGRYVPSVEGSRVRDVIAVASWWRFLIAAHIVYGLGPRLVMFFIAALMRSVSIRSVRFDWLAWGGARKRLLSFGGEVADRSGENAAPAKTLTLKEPARVIFWRDFPAGESEAREFLRNVFGIEVRSFHPVGGNASDPDGSQLPTSAGKDASVWAILVEDWESPGLAFKQLAVRLRDQGNDVVVIPARKENQLLTPAAGSKLELWRKHVDQLADPRIGMLI